MSDEEHNAPTLENEEVAPKVEDANAPINIKVRCSYIFCGLVLELITQHLQVLSATGDEVFFKIKRSTKLSKLQTAYAHKIGKEVNTIRYVLRLAPTSLSNIMLTHTPPILDSCTMANESTKTTLQLA